MTIDGTADGLRTDTTGGASRFTGPHEHRFFADAGHNLPQERPHEWADAVLRARAMAAARSTARP